MKTVFSVLVFVFMDEQCALPCVYHHLHRIMHTKNCSVALEKLVGYCQFV